MKTENPISKTARVAVVGASGYSGEELVRLLLLHPGVELTAVTSRQHAGKPLSGVFPRFSHYPGAADLHFREPDLDRLRRAADFVFLALPHGVAFEYAVPLLDRGCRVIDLSADFRLDDPAIYSSYYGGTHPSPEWLPKAVYGLPEVLPEAVRDAALVASPGCYPTSILLPLIPLLRRKLICKDGIIANSLSGVSGAGRKVDLPYLFVECNESLRPYGVPRHRHVSEIEQELSKAAGTGVVIQFTPHLVPVSRGILTTLYVAPQRRFESQAEAGEILGEIGQCYADAYRNQPFVRLLGAGGFPDTKNVVGSNVLEIAWSLDPRTGRLIVMSAEDNLLKGASGQAVQCLNLMLGLPETTGLV